MDAQDLLVAQATELEKRKYKFRVTSRGYEVYWRHHVLARVEHYGDDLTANSAEHIRLAQENLRAAVDVAMKHEAGIRKYKLPKLANPLHPLKRFRR